MSPRKQRFFKPAPRGHFQSRRKKGHGGNNAVTFPGHPAGVKTKSCIVVKDTGGSSSPRAARRPGWFTRPEFGAALLGVFLQLSITRAAPAAAAGESLEKAI